MKRSQCWPGMNRSSVTAKMKSHFLRMHSSLFQMVTFVPNFRRAYWTCFLAWNIDNFWLMLQYRAQTYSFVWIQMIIDVLWYLCALFATVSEFCSCFCICRWIGVIMCYSNYACCLHFLDIAVSSRCKMLFLWCASVYALSVKVACGLRWKSSREMEKSYIFL